MRKHFAAFAICFALGLATLAQASSRPARQDRDKDKDDQVKHAQKAQEVKLTHGPVVESAKSNSATIAWSTNVNASTILKYGTDPNNLSETAEAPWGGVTHRVRLRNLQPGTTYYYRVESTQAQGTGSQAVSQIAQFRTEGGTAAAPAQAATPAVPSGEELPLRNFHAFLVSHPNLKADLEKNPNLSRDGRYLATHPGLTGFLQTHPGVRQYLAQNPTAFMQAEETMR
jgi:hypothetical protein